MKNIVAWMLVLMVTLSSFPAFAQEATITPLNKGDIAPYSGVLLSPEASAQLTTELNNLAEKIKIEVEKAKQEEQAACTQKLNDANARSTQQAQEAAAKLLFKQNENVVLMKRLQAAESANNRTWLYVGSGFVGGVLVTLGTVFIVSRMK